MSVRFGMGGGSWVGWEGWEGDMHVARTDWIQLIGRGEDASHHGREQHRAEDEVSFEGGHYGVSVVAQPSAHDNRQSESILVSMRILIIINPC